MKHSFAHPDFNLEATLDCGQVFGFTKSSDNIYSGAIRGHALSIWQKEKTLHFKPAANGISKDLIEEYFDLKRDLTPIYDSLLSEECLAPALEKFKGLRLIRQDSWEALACFIISSNNNVKRIQGIWKNLCEYFSPVGATRRVAPTFPSAIQIAKVHERILRELGLGYRAPFLHRTAIFLSTNPQYLETIRAASYDEAKKRVLNFPGIGPKVADCALLYGFHKLEAFPVDVWILRVMRRLYFKNRKVSEEKVHAFGQKRWGERAGYVQQYLFHSVRMSIL